jgi:hypothetical protein
MDFKIEINAKQIASEFGKMAQEVEQSVTKAVEAVSMATHARALEIAKDRLKSTFPTYADALSWKKVADGFWLVELDMKKAGWIEDGRKSGFMEELLRGKSAKTSAKGKKYAIIPFKHNKTKEEGQTTKGAQLMGQIKEFLKEKNISQEKLEHNTDGSPKLGLLHRFDIDSAKPSAKAKYPALKGVSIYQREHTDKDTGVKSTKREVMTFRIITEDHKAEGKWNHPGSKGAFIIDEVFMWASTYFDTVALPSVLERFK